MQFPKSRKIYLGSFYEPHKVPLEHIEHLEESLIEMHTMCMCRHPNVIIAGNLEESLIEMHTMCMCRHPNVIIAGNLEESLIEMHTMCMCRHPNVIIAGNL